MNDIEILRVWAQMANCWRQFTVPAGGDDRAVMLEDWRPFLADVDLASARAAVQLLAAQEWPPPPGRLRLEALRLSGAPGAPPEDVAWLEVRREISRVGSYDQPRFSHPAIEEAVNVVGWRILCMANEDDLSRFRQWRDFYRAIAARADAVRLPAGPALARADGPRELGA